MAKKKTVDAVEEAAPAIEPAVVPEVENPEPGTETVDAVEEAALVDAADTESEVKAEPVEKIKPAADLGTLPVQAVDYLKRHPEVDALYIDKFGGIFPKNTPKVFVKDAVLYQNPYFKQ